MEAFVMRARRIESHSLLSDLGQFVKWVSGSARIEGQGRETSDGIEMVDPTLEVDLPPEEVFESLVARVRPLTLQDEGVYHGKVLSALRAFVRDDPARRKKADWLRDEWRKVKQPDNPILLGVVPQLERPTEAASYVAVADAWLYGDLLHCDPRRLEQVGGVPLGLRYFAAVLVYGQSALRAVATLNLIREWQSVGVLDLDPAAGSEPVTVNLPFVLPIRKMNLLPTPDESVLNDSPGER